MFGIRLGWGHGEFNANFLGDPQCGTNPTQTECLITQSSSGLAYGTYRLFNSRKYGHEVTCKPWKTPQSILNFISPAVTDRPS